MRTLAIIALLCCAVPFALAHPGHGTTAGDGFLHPLLGLDHLLAMVAVGLLAARATGRHAWWLLPATFVTTAIIGGACGRVTLLPVEHLVAASVLALGALVTLARPLPLTALVGVVAVAGAVHGHAHAADAGGMIAPAFALGAVVATTLLHATGVAAGLALRGRALGVVRLAGLAIALTGAVLIPLV